MLKYFLALMLLVALPSCVNLLHSPNHSLASKDILQPYLPEAIETQKRWLAATGDDDENSKVKVFLPNKDVQRIKGPDLNFSAILDSLPNNEIEALRKYLFEFRGMFGDFSVQQNKYDLLFVNQHHHKDRHFVRYMQVIRREVKGNAYLIPISGASITVTISKGRIREISSRLTSVPALSLALVHPGFKFDFSDSEFMHFFETIKLNEKSRDILKNFLEKEIASRSKQKLDFDGILNASLPQQREAMNRFFGALQSTSTARFMIDLAQHKQLSLVRYGDKWMFEVTQFFGLPIQFDVQVPNAKTEKLVVKNLRDLSHSLSTFRAFQSPLYPNGKKTEVDAQSQIAVQKMQQVLKYYQDHFGWSGYSGKSNEDTVDLHTMLRTASFLENAAWLPKQRVFLIGKGGDNFQDLDKSLSILGHEFAHAIMQFSSGLIYKGQTGALNEHFADIEGVSIDSEISNNSQFTYSVGADVLNPAVKVEKEKLLEKIQTTSGFSPQDVQTYALNKIAVRHLYAPSLSFATQYDSISSAQKEFPDNCEPSVDNDNCGVHSQSGIPNKVASLIIANLGYEATRSLFFNTLIYRLTQESNFTDYLVQMHEECQSTPALADKCHVIIASFAAAGVKYPGNAIIPRSSETPETKDSNVVGANMLSNADYSVSPTLEFCGKVVEGPHESLRVRDGKINPVFVTRDSKIITKGNFEELKSHSCACVSGQITQVVLKSGKVFNAFLNISKIKDSDLDVCTIDESQNFSRGVPVLNQVADTMPKSFCGWVKVETSKDVEIVDNKYNVSLMASKSEIKTSGDFSSIYKMQCACVTGEVAQTKDNQQRTFNYFKSLPTNAIQAQPIENCSSVKWK